MKKNIVKTKIESESKVFQIKLPSQETIEAMENTLANRNMETVSIEELINQAKSRVK